jgi:hypothetical protein
MQTLPVQTLLSRLAGVSLPGQKVRDTWWRSGGKQPQIMESICCLAAGKSYGGIWHHPPLGFLLPSHVAMEEKFEG